MTYRERFEALIAELDARPEIQLKEATLGPPTPPEEIARWREVAGAAWPEKMTELYQELSFVDIEYRLEGASGGAVHIPTLGDLWDYEALEDELWFDFLGEKHPFHAIRPIDRFVPEAYAVLYRVPPEGNAKSEAKVAYHYCGESLVPTGKTFAQWLELLFRTRGTAYWLDLLLGPGDGHRTWVEDNIDAMAALFPDFAPAELRPARARREVNLDFE